MASNSEVVIFRFRGLIETPPRATQFGVVVLILLIVGLGLSQTHALPHPPALLWFNITVLMLPLAIASRSIYTVHFNLLLVCIYLTNFLPHFALYPFSQLTMLILYAYMVMAVPALRTSAGWLKVGSFNGMIVALIVATVVVSCVALVAWVKLVNPDLSGYKESIPNVSPGLMALYGIGFCTFNAALEEITWRGVMMEALDSALGPGWWAIVIQAGSFAVAHYRGGFPNGIVGSLMVFAYGLMLGFIRRKSRGIVGCWLAHVAADLTIYCLIFYFIQKSSK